MILESQIEWKPEFSKKFFFFDDWQTFLNFFSIDGNQEISFQNKLGDENGIIEQDVTVKISEIPSFKTDVNHIYLQVQTKNKLIDFSTSAQCFKGKEMVN